VPDVSGAGDRLQRVTHPDRPPTLGDQLNEAMRLHGDTPASDAGFLGAPVSDVLDWTADAALRVTVGTAGTGRSGRPPGRACTPLPKCR